MSASPVWRLLRDLIHEKAGIYFGEDNIDLMVGKISDLMAEQNVDSPLDYYYMLKYEGEAGEEWIKVLNAISVRETYFWREMGQIRTLVDTLVPSIAEKYREPVRIWSAACASGEEPITIAMALHDAGWFDRIPIEIYASDVSAAALCAAQRGVYRQHSFRSLPEHLRDRYFKPVAGGWQVDPGLLRRITWRRANLTRKPEIQELAQSRIVFCRNVFIYFSEPMIRRVVATYAELMPYPGYLFVGAAESLLKFSSQFQLKQIEGSFVYVKE
jgi:chemotaxis protein methyltransferase CheR